MVCNNNIINNEVCFLFFYKYDGKIDDLRVQEEELQSIRFFPIAQLEEEVHENPGKFVPHGSYWFEMIDEIKKKVGK